MVSKIIYLLRMYINDKQTALLFLVLYIPVRLSYGEFIHTKGSMCW